MDSAANVDLKLRSVQPPVGNLVVCERPFTPHLPSSQQIQRGVALGLSGDLYRRLIFRVSTWPDLEQTRQLIKAFKAELVLATLLPSAYPVVMTKTVILERATIVRRGQRLEYFTIIWNLLEGLVAVVTGAMAGSISLVGFGIDSFVEVTSGTAVLWRIAVDSDVHRREVNEKRALRAVGTCFLALSAYITYESIVDLWLKRAPEQSVPGIILACVSVVVMPALSRAKRKVGSALGSAAMHADAKQAEFCTYLSAILLGGLLLNALLGLWWADPLAALIMAPIIAKEGFEGLRGNACRDCVAS